MQFVSQKADGEMIWIEMDLSDNMKSTNNMSVKKIIMGLKEAAKL